MAATGPSATRGFGWGCAIAWSRVARQPQPKSRVAHDVALSYKVEDEMRLSKGKAKLRAKWSLPHGRKKIIEQLEGLGVAFDHLVLLYAA